MARRWESAPDIEVEVSSQVDANGSTVWLPAGDAAYPTMEFKRGRERAFSEIESQQGQVALDNSAGIFNANTTTGLTLGASEVRVRAFGDSQTNYAALGFSPNFVAYIAGEVPSGVGPGLLCPGVGAAVSNTRAQSGDFSLRVVYGKDTVTPRVVDTGYGSVDTGSSITVTLSTSGITDWEDGDLMIIQVMTSNQNATGTTAASATGWTQIRTETLSTESQVKTTWLSRVLQTGDTSWSFSVGGSQQIGWSAVVIRDQASSSPISQSVSGECATQGGSAGVPANVTLEGASASTLPTLVVDMAAVDVGASTDQTFTHSEHFATMVLDQDHIGADEQHHGIFVTKKLIHEDVGPWEHTVTQPDRADWMHMASIYVIADHSGENVFDVDQYAVVSLAPPRLTESFTVSAYVYMPTASTGSGLEAYLTVAGIEYADLPSSAKTTTKDAWTRLYLTVDPGETQVFAINNQHGGVEHGPFQGLEVHLAVGKANEDPPDEVWWDSLQVEGGTSATTFGTDPPDTWWLFRGPIRSASYGWGGVATNQALQVSVSDRLSLLGEIAPMPSLFHSAILWMDGAASPEQSANSWQALSQPHITWSHLTDGQTGHATWAEVVSTPHPHE